MARCDWWRRWPCWVERPAYIDTQLTFYIFTAIMFLFAVIALYKIVTSPLGLIFKLIRENASRAEQ